jgi:hypothetical protein
MKLILANLYLVQNFPYLQGGISLQEGMGERCISLIQHLSMTVN